MKADDNPLGDLRPFVAPVYWPWFTLSVGIGMLSLALPLYLVDAGFSFTRTALVLLAAGLGATVCGVPVGGRVARSGERIVTLIALLAGGVVVALLGATDAVAPLFALMFTFGVANVAVRLSAQSSLQRGVAPAVRGRAMAGIGGTRRIGVFIGPLAGGLLVDSVGFSFTFVIAGVVVLAGVPPRLLGRVHGARAESSQLTIAETLRRYWRRLLWTGSGTSLIMAVRSGRAVILPLIGDDIGLSATQVGIVVGVSTGADLVLFPVAGHLMDRYGRLTAIVPAFTLMGLGLLLLAVAGTGSIVAVSGAVIGIGNGLSSGALLTLGSDLAPAEAPAPFMAAFGSMNDLGQVLGPLIVGVAADAIGLGAAAVALAIAMFVGVALVVTTIGETGSDLHPARVG